MTDPGGSRPPLPRNVTALSVVSFLTDVSSEMIYPLLPVFLTTVLGAGAGAVGIIEGAAESTAALLKLASGWWSDRVRRKPLVVFGYGLSALARPLMAMAGNVGQVLAVRMTDRVGKGIRSSPRDALIADVVAPSERGRAFGVHRAADNAGAVLGPLIAWMLLQPLALSVRSVMWWAAVPGAMAVVVLAVWVREGERRPAAPHAAAVTDAPLGAAFWRYLGVLLLFTLGNSSDAFLLLRATQLGVPVAVIPLLWTSMSVVKSASSIPGGMLITPSSLPYELMQPGDLVALDLAGKPLHPPEPGRPQRRPSSEWRLSLRGRRGFQSHRWLWSPK